MTLKELINQMDSLEPKESNLLIDQQIEKLKESRKSVFTIHIENGDKIVSGDFDYDQTEMINGYLAADPRSNYFGYLRDLHLVNERVVYNSDEVLTLIEATAKHNGKI